MEKMKVKELMRPVTEFPTISSSATFKEAVEALEKAQEAFRSGKATQRILMVQDKGERSWASCHRWTLFKVWSPTMRGSIA